MKVHLPIVGKATGSSAGLIYQSYWGNTYTRSFPFSFHYPDTSKQQKSQFDFFKIQRVWWGIYEKLKTSIPASCRKNRNVFNELSSGIYRIFMTYMQKSSSNIVDVWGLDSRKSVKLNINAQFLDFLGDEIIVNAKVLDIYGKRKFVPDFFNTLLCNITEQEFYFIMDDYSDGSLTTSFKVEGKWDETDIIVAYTALSSKEFITNFYFCGKCIEK